MRYYKEILVIEAIVFTWLWATNEYIATMMTFICVPIFASILVISAIAEIIEPSKIGKHYYFLMVGLTLIPVVIFTIIFIINKGTSFDWAK